MVPKLIIGFVLGVIVTLAAMQWMDLSENSNGKQAGLPQMPGESDRVPTSSGTAAATKAPATSGSPGDETAIDNGREPSLDVTIDPSPSLESVAAQGTISTLGNRRANSANPAADTGAGRAANASQYPPEIAEMIEKSVDKELQARYESDEREDSWAPYMEGLLAAYFAQKPELALFYISLIDCRTSICSIHAMGYGPDALAQWTVATADLVSQPWFEFNDMSMNRRNPVPDVLAVVLILTRNPST